ncbi:MAG: HD-GYP domain-containing protein [Pseudodesulfovibrio sp.]|uniref:HD-GYP domain-containing protein n=1 Tax=Pseudodesulfovibrio sp. TaxID=2035812 RepID=UPI003D137ED7
MLKEISVRRLTPGMYVSLRNVPWFRHPFLRSSFEIKNREEVREIIAIGRETVLYDPEKSKAEPLKADSRIKVDAATAKSAVSHSRMKFEKASELRARRVKFQRMEENFEKAVVESRVFMSGVMSGEVARCEEAKKTALQMSKVFLEETEMCVSFINASATDDGQEFHSLNVMTLSLMLGADLGYDAESMADLAFGGLMHDIGLLKLPKGLQIKPNRSPAETKMFQEHPRLGVSVLSRMPDISRDVMKIVYQHHEECTGRGYPKGATKAGIIPPARIVAIADTYDRLINTRDPSKAVSPHKALALMFGKYKDRFDPDMLTRFIKILGVYPPGTVCRFTSGDIGVIMSVDPKDLLHPEVILFDPAIPKHEAIIYRLGIDLDIVVESTLRPDELDAEAFNYLNSRTKIQYYPSPCGH